MSPQSKVGRYVYCADCGCRLEMNGVCKICGHVDSPLLPAMVPNLVGKTEAEAAIDEAVENAKKVKSASNTKGGEGLSEAGRTENMSEADFIKAFNAHGGDL